MPHRPTQCPFLFSPLFCPNPLILRSFSEGRQNARVDIDGPDYGGPQSKGEQWRTTVLWGPSLSMSAVCGQS